MTSSDEWPRPTRTEPRAADPPHDDLTPRPVLLTAQAAAELARDRLARWRREQ
jgi:hypothetical protein